MGCYRSDTTDQMWVTIYVKVLYFTYTSIRPDFNITIRSSFSEICITPYGGEAGYERSVFNILMCFIPDVNSVSVIVWKGSLLFFSTILGLQNTNIAWAKDLVLMLAQYSRRMEKSLLKSKILKNVTEQTNNTVSDSGVLVLPFQKAGIAAQALVWVFYHSR